MASQARLAAYKRHKGGILVLSEGEHPAPAAQLAPALDQRLQDAGADERLAEAVVATLGAAVSEHVATKTDLEKLELRMTIKLYAAVGIGVGLIKGLDFLIG